ncbi:MAG: hypothetical protein KDA47_18755 [Planctomycetales bacterium]|nr:hypothetical protein [Planctomycetales bacterium]
MATDQLLDRARCRAIVFVAIFMSAISSGAYAANSSGESKSEPFRLMSAAKDRQFRAMLPPVEDAEMQRTLEDPALILYTDAEITPAFQDWGSGLPGIHSVMYNISANGTEPFGNGNREFPWNVAGGTHRTTNVTTFRFLRLPQNEQGETLPIVWYRSSQADDRQTGYSWIYPVGTLFGEVLMMRGPDGKQYVFELRVRSREQSAWKVDLYRPFRNPEQLANRIRELRPQWESTPALTKLVAHLESEPTMKRHTLADNHPHVAFRATAGVDELPAVGDDELVRELLTGTTFQSVLGDAWRADQQGVRAFAPTTSAAFHIVPARYDAGFLENDSRSCMRCHDTVNQHVNRFDFGRDWYGHIRGSDGIFSFHPFDPSCISHNGFGVGVRMNSRLEQAGLLAQYNATQHPVAKYQRIPKLF